MLLTRYRRRLKNSWNRKPSPVEKESSSEQPSSGSTIREQWKRINIVIKNFQISNLGTYTRFPCPRLDGLFFFFHVSLSHITHRGREKKAKQTMVVFFPAPLQPTVLGSEWNSDWRKGTFQIFVFACLVCFPQWRFMRVSVFFSVVCLLDRVASLDSLNLFSLCANPATWTFKSVEMLETRRWEDLAGGWLDGFRITKKRTETMKSYGSYWMLKKRKLALILSGT